MTRRVTLREAAEALGISKDAVRKRVSRGTLVHDKGEDGRVYVYVPGGGDAGTDAGEDAVPPGVDAGPDDLQDHGLHDHRDERIAELQETVRDLRVRLDRAEEARNEADRENRRLLALALEQRPAIEAPSEQRDAPETPPATPGSPSPRSGTTGRQEGVQKPKTARRPWWVRWFGG